ncbi:GUN4 domain-containing protein [Microcoleus sp.]|uniref:GUN4 domain-containing protein n=1 Tax=Microcoleus sp. TaxID=44472 RepID=UPI003525FDC9
MQHWAKGQQLHEGKYLIEQILGGGGFGVTYRAQNRKAGKLVAIKTLNAIQQGKPDFVKRQGKFMNEALCLAKCHHPHVVEVYEVFQEGDLWCMVMELLDGTNLAEHLEDNGVLSEENALPIIQQVGNALSFIHKQGFTHQDVKPQNIMLRTPPAPLAKGGERENSPFNNGGEREISSFAKGGEREISSLAKGGEISSSPLTKGGQGGAVLIDFGLARQATIPGKLRTNSNSGTECFAPLELLEKRAEFGAYTDVYSLAATLYVMLTGKLPFPSQIRNENIPLTPPKQHNNKISDRVNAAIMKGMELEPQNRPQSVQEWLDLLIPKPVAAETTRVISAVGMDYINLRNLLAAKKWKEADEETGRVMLKVAGREEKGWLNSESIDNFPCEDLRTIDQLWVKYSNGRFGFSVQKRIYQSLGGTREYDRKVWEAFGDKVGWRKKNEWLYYNDDLTYSEKAPEAHLPVLRGFSVRRGLGMAGGMAAGILLSRRDL